MENPRTEENYHSSFDGAVLGYDKKGKLVAVSLFGRRAGITEKYAKELSSEGGLKTKSVGMDRARKEMERHNWGVKR